MSEPEVQALARSLRRVAAIILLDPTFEPQATLATAWLYQLAVGWDCAPGHCEDPDNPVHMCTGALDELAAVNGWPDWFVAQLRDARRGVRMLLAEVDELDRHQAWSRRGMGDT